MNKRAFAALFLVLLHAAGSALAGHKGAHAEAVPPQIEEMSIAGLGQPPKDPSNRWADDPRAAQLGQRLFFDARLSSNGQVSCASCHDPARQFQDGTPLARGVGTTDRRTMPIAGTAYSPFLFWDGRKDSQWAQALGPLESAVEHGGTRAQYADVIALNYRDEYQRVFGALPEGKDRESVTQVFVNIGKAIAAYERGVGFMPSRFDVYVERWKKDGRPPADVLTPDEAAGLDLFVGKANCTQCHNGPLFTNNEFHNTGVPKRAGLPDDRGRIVAVKSVQSDEFNCRSRWSDAKPGQCSELEYLAPASPPLERAYKVPSLRNVAQRAPYMHAGQLSTLGEVVRHYNDAPAAPAGHSELKPLALTRAEMRQIEAFLGTLSGGTSGN